MFKLVFFSCLLLPGAVCAAQPLIVSIPTPGPPSSDRAFHIELLRLAMDKSGHEYEFKFMPGPLPQKRRIGLVASGSPELTVVWAHADEEMEKKMNPIRIPIYSGLFEYNLLQIRNGNQEQFDRIESANDFAGLVGVNPPNWSTLAVLQANDIRVIAADTPNIPLLIASRRADFFMRSLYGAMVDQNQSSTKVVLEKRLVFRIPTGFYYFVSHKNDALHSAIEKGLIAAHQDGSYKKLWDSNEATRTVIEDSRLAERHVIELKNPEFAKVAKLQDTRFMINFSALPTEQTDASSKP